MVTIGNQSSPTTQIAYGVLQGSILGPILFSIYMLLLDQIIQRNKLSFHCYADDTKMSPAESKRSEKPGCCFRTAPIFLQLNNSKSEILLFNLPTTITSPISLGPFSNNIKQTARNLDVILD